MLKNFFTKNNSLHIVISMIISLIVGFILSLYKPITETIVLSGVITLMLSIWFQGLDAYRKHRKSTKVALIELLSDLVGILISSILLLIIL